MTTISILVLAILSNLRRLVEDLKVEPENNQRRIDELRKTYIGFLDPVTLIPSSKLILNRHNDKFYQTYLVPLDKPPRRNLKASEQLLRKGFEWFCEKVREWFGERRDGAELARFVDMVADRLFFTVISVTEELNAFKVFETLNARGVRLSATDLLKNYLFSVVFGAGGHESEMEVLEERWEAIVDKLGGESVPDFLRVYWNSLNPLTRQAELFKAIRSKVKDKAAVFTLLREMDRDADIYAALGNQNDDTWNIDQRKHVGELELFQVRQPYALLLAARRSLNDAEFTRVLRACVIISFRYNIIGNLATSEQERVYNAVAEKIARGELTTATDVIRALKPIYPSDAQFKTAFAEKQIRTTTTRNCRVVRYILFEIERQESGVVFDLKSDKYSVEHILPEHPDENWTRFTDEEVDRCVYRIGNMTPMATGANRDIGNCGYDEKKVFYGQSEFEITKRIPSEHAEWTPDSIATRQQWLATQAVSIWSLAELQEKS